MANTPLEGKKVSLEYDVSLTATPDWKVVACITDTDLDSSRETIDVSSKCGPGTLAGQATNSVNFTGFFIIDEDTEQVSGQTLADINFNQDGVSKHWRLIDEDTGGALYYREFNGPLTAYNESSNNNEAVTFTGTISIIGNVETGNSTT